MDEITVSTISYLHLLEFPHDVYDSYDTFYMFNIISYHGTVLILVLFEEKKLHSKHALYEYYES